MNSLHKLYVAYVTNDVKNNPGCKEDTERFPYLIPYVEDECELFVVDESTENFWQASEFFDMTDCKEIFVHPEDLGL